MMGFLKKMVRVVSGVRETDTHSSASETAWLEQLLVSLMNDASTRDRVHHILKFNEADASLSNIVAKEERALPANENFLKSGWYKTMLARYALAIYYSRGKMVLDTCSGLGWGAYLMDSSAREVFCVDLDERSIRWALQTWPYERTRAVCSSVLTLPYRDGTFDVVTAMESLEHFTLEDARIYLSEIGRVLKTGGMLIGSTPLPPTEDGKKQEMDQNPFHLHVFDSEELKVFLSKKFLKVHIYSNNRFFQAVKG